MWSLLEFKLRILLKEAASTVLISACMTRDHPGKKARLVYVPESPTCHEVKMSPVFVTRTFMPPWPEFEKRLKSLFQSACITNQGPLVSELKETLQEFLKVQKLQILANGTLALQAAIRACDVTGAEIITTPFSYVATVSSILWEHCTPVFVDIDPDTLMMDPERVEAVITPQTKALLPVHVFGYPCDVDGLQSIADRYDLKIIYDGAHAFGSQYRGRSLLAYGDVSTCSFHATKLFHTGEGGCCISKTDFTDQKIDMIKRFGHTGDDHICLGVNMKMSELHAAMGLSVMPYLPDIFSTRKQLSALYDELLNGAFERPRQHYDDFQYNYAYYPVLFPNEKLLLKALSALSEKEIYPRRYFFPSLNKLKYLNRADSCPIAEDIASRIVCLPLFTDLAEKDVRHICKVVREFV